MEIVWQTWINRQVILVQLSRWPMSVDAVLNVCTCKCFSPEHLITRNVLIFPERGRTQARRGGDARFRFDQINYMVKFSPSTSVTISGRRVFHNGIKLISNFAFHQCFRFAAVDILRARELRTKFPSTSFLSPGNARVRTSVWNHLRVLVSSWSRTSLLILPPRLGIWYYRHCTFLAWIQ